MDGWEDALKELRKEFVEGLDERFLRISTALALLAHQPKDQEALKTLLRQFHALAGSGSTYGFPEITQIGQQGERECDGFLQAHTTPTTEDLNRWQQLLEKLRAEVANCDLPDTQSAGHAAEQTAIEQPFNFRILIVDDNEQSTGQLQRLLEQDGMLVEIVPTKAAALEALLVRMPDGIIVDITLPDGSGYELVDYLRNLPGGEELAILMISNLNSFFDKVEAIRCGADGYFEKADDWGGLLRRLQILLDKNRTEPARILSVEDDTVQAAYVRMVLESAGYQVKLCEDPRDLEEILSSFRPDLVLMDIILPFMSGYDLARYLRQHEHYATLPIIFLTTQGQLQVRLETIKVGGDDHLIKPVNPALLLSSVAARIERARFLKSLVERDGLTRLLTHTSFLERAKVAIYQQSRNKRTATALVMLDLDHFKSINDRFGHPVGDRVLAALSAMLRRRLRQSDTIGRYGGEEFAILLEDLSKDEAMRLVNRLREEFATIEHLSNTGTPFKATFSAGIAMLTPEMDLESWKESSDQALYAAKAAGRNCVELVGI